MTAIKIGKKEDRAAYEYFRRYNLRVEILHSLNGKTIFEAASSMGMNTTSLLICIGHLRRAGVVKEVRIV